LADEINKRKRGRCGAFPLLCLLPAYYHTMRDWREEIHTIETDTTMNKTTLSDTFVCPDAHRNLKKLNEYAGMEIP
jgi:hypothetical protein